MNVFLKTKDYFLSGEQFNLVYDEEHKLLKTHPVPDTLEKYYEAKYISHTDENKSFIGRLYHAVKKRALIKKVRLVKKFIGTSGTLLDIGAGTGAFLVTAKSNGFNVMGVEPSAKARLLAVEKGISMQSAVAHIDSNLKFDVVTMWHVLEHLPDIDQSVQEILDLVSEGGYFFVAVPNYKSFDACYYKKHWAAYDVPRHVWHFSQESMELLAEKWGVQLIKTKPMWYDSFYVSLLSEKYKTGRSNYIKAFFIGLWSNLKAIKSGEFSSLIYIFQTKN